MNGHRLDSTYDEDFFAWTQGQASALRDMPAASVGNHIDVAHVAEEIEDLGKRELREVKSLLSRVLEHLVKIAHDRGAASTAHWTLESLVFQRDAFNSYSPGMRQYLDMADLWHQGRRFAAAALNLDERTLTVPPECPFSLDDLITDDFDIARALDRVSNASRAT